MSNYSLSKHAKGDRVKWIITFVAIILLAVGVAAALTVGFTNANPYGWLDKRFVLKSDMPELTADVLPEDGESPYTLFQSYNDGQAIDLVYTTDSTMTEYILTVDEGVPADDVTAVGESTEVYKFLVKGEDGEIPVGEWVRMTEDNFIKDNPDMFALLYEADGTIAPTDEIADLIFMW